MTWAVGDTALWLGRQRMPSGGSWNPPPPGWTPPTPEQAQQARLLRRMMVVKIEQVDAGGIPRLARAEDGFEFDPSRDISRLQRPADIERLVEATWFAKGGQPVRVGDLEIRDRAAEVSP